MVFIVVFLPLAGMAQPALAPVQEEAKAGSFKPLQDRIQEYQQAFRATNIDPNEVFNLQGDDCPQADRKQIANKESGRTVSAASAADDIAFLMKTGEIRAYEAGLPRLAVDFRIAARPWRKYMAFHAEICTKNLEAAYQNFAEADLPNDARRVAERLFAQKREPVWQCRAEKQTISEAKTCQN